MRDPVLGAQERQPLALHLEERVQPVELQLAQLELVLERREPRRRRRRPAARARGCSPETASISCWSAASFSFAACDPVLQRAIRASTDCFLSTMSAPAGAATTSTATSARRRIRGDAAHLRACDGFGWARAVPARRRARRLGDHGPLGHGCGSAGRRARCRPHRALSVRAPSSSPTRLAVVLVGDLARAVVELELLQRRERAVALLLEREPLARRSALRAAPRGRRQERPGDEPDGGDGQQRAEDERGGEHSGLCGDEAAVADASRRSSRASGQSVIDRAEQEDEPGEPDQVDERVDDRLEVDRPVRVHLLGDQEQVLAGQPVGADRDLVRDLLLDRVVVLARGA